jgi:class 3 adenylate cyclase
MKSCHRCGAARAQPDRFCAACGAALGPPTDPLAVRKHVVVMFIDIVGSTALGERLDPESLRGQLERYFETVSAVLWRCGATVEKFIGDAVMAMFGVPVAREDDASRALRAAEQVHAAVGELTAGLRVRIGVNGGEVFVARHADGQFAVTGDVVNVAARLEQAAAPGETLVGGTVPHLAGPTAPLVPGEPLLVRGKSAPLPVWRLRTGVADPGRPPMSIPMVGRTEELADLRRIADRVVQDRDSWLVTVLGSAGVGKSRLVAEFVGGLDGPRVFEGHCPSYASGGAFRPLAQVLEQLGEDWRTQVGMLIGGAEAALVTDRLATAIGRAGDGTSLPDIVWAARQLVQALSRDRPLVLVWEDLQWAESTFVEFLDRLSAGLYSVPVLMVCLGRPDLLEQHPGWGGGRSRSMSMELRPLPAPALYELADALVGAVTAHSTTAPDLTRMVDLSEGNPLIFLQMVEDVAAGSPVAPVPVTVQMLFQARLDRLDPADRQFCACASVLGREFWPEAVRFAAGVPGDVETLDRLVRLRVLQPTQACNAGRPSHRFTHALLMETAYRASPKSERSRWHERVARWLASAPDLSEGERGELVAYHLERAHALRSELDGTDPGLAVRAGEAALLAADQCLARSDLPAATRHLENAQRLLPTGDVRHRRIAYRLVEGLLTAGRPDGATAALDRADTALAGDPVWRILAPVTRAGLALHLDAGARQDAHRVARCAIVELSGDLAAPDALLWAHELAALAAGTNLQLVAAERSVRTALGYARAAGDRYAERRLLCGVAELAFWGPTPLPEARSLCWTVLPTVRADLQLTAPVLGLLAGVAATTGHDDAARALISRVWRITADLDLPRTAAMLRQFSGLIAWCAGDHEAAAAEYRTGAAGLADQDPVAPATLTVLAARALLDGGRPDAAAHLFGWGDEPVPAFDAPYYQGMWYGLAARLAAADGTGRRARRWAAASVRAAASAQMPLAYGDALLDLALVHRRLGEAERSHGAFAASIRQYERKGATRHAERARALRAGTP